MQRLLTRLYSWIASPRFFRCVVILAVISAAWIALTGQYPMAFDEDFHLGLIRVYASHSLPFFSSQPSNADAYGAVARDPSFLFHYLMSFPYRLVCLVTQNQTAQVLVLRALNIALFASCLPLFRRLLRQAGASPALAHGCLALFVLIPITPLLAAQINYDNAALPLTAWLLLLALRVPNETGQSRQLTFLKILAVGLTGSLIKFAFLPIFVGVVLWLLVTVRPWHFAPRQFLVTAMTTLKTRLGASLVVLIVLLGVLAGNRYGVNLVRYHDPIPDCGKVLTINHCQNYGPYIRDYNFAQAKPSTHTNPYNFMKEWLYGMWLRSVFSVGGPKTTYETKGPLYAPAYVVIVLLALGAIALLVRARQTWRSARYSSSLFAVISTIYIAALWLQEYKAYRHTGYPVAINGRYLLLVIIPIAFVAARALSLLLRQRRDLKTALLGVSLLALLWGGGELTFILRSNPSWYWNNPAVRVSNRAVQKIVGPVTPGNYNPTAFLR
ncbi:MAG: hypothetical protein QFB87_03635 [Patescibacteria group bacterium]|nr:hypothetical protein [Patescibacteria group bacterium]